MAGSREVLTFQFGNYSNYVGAHLWNMQEQTFRYDESSELGDSDPSVLYREGINHLRQPTFTPRALVVDLEGAQKHLSTAGELYGYSIVRNNDEPLAINKLKEEAKVTQETDDIEILEEHPADRHAFQRDVDDHTVDIANKNYNFAHSVDSWPDFLYARFHPRSVQIINKYKHSSEKHSFVANTAGRALWLSEEFSEDFTDKIRQYVEECDHLQGFQMLLDADTGFGGLAHKCLEHLNDEYNKASLALPLFQPRNILYGNADGPNSDSVRVINSVLCFSELIEMTSLFAPLSTQSNVWRRLGPPRKFPLINFEAENLYQTSAILATFIDTLSLRYRCRNATALHTMENLCSSIVFRGRKLAATGLSLPLPIPHDQYLIDFLNNTEDSLLTQLTPNCKVGLNYVVQTLNARGIPIAKLKPIPEKASNDHLRMAAYHCTSVSEMLQLYLQCNYHASKATVVAFTEPMPTAVPFPTEMFNENLNSNGFVTDTMRASNDNLKSTPVVAGLQSSAEIGDMLGTLQHEAKRIKIAKLHFFATAGLEHDEYSESLERIENLKENYDDGFQL